MTDWLGVLRLVSDPTRLRILHSLRHDSLSVAEVQEVLGMGQSRISTHLGQLRDGGLLTDRREGKKIYYRWADEIGAEIERLIETTLEQSGMEQELKRDSANLSAVVQRRKELSESYFNALAGRGSRGYCPGRGWQSVALAFLEMLPPLDIADLGAGEGRVSRLLARRARKVIAVDISARMVSVGRDEARELGIANLEFREGDLEDPPIEAGTVDVALFSQALHHAPSPERALAAAWKILRPGGRLVVLDLKQHHFDAARELYSDTWLGFRETDLERWISRAGFQSVVVSVVEREAQAPHFQSVLATATRPAA
jgi:ArsR family transcriptional regulator